MINSDTNFDFMCGIFGIIAKEGSTINYKSLRKFLGHLAIYSESRGKDSSGIAIRHIDQHRIDVIKGDVPIRNLLKSKEYDKAIIQGLSNFKEGSGFSAFGHARLVTNGSQLKEVNNQPVLKDDILIIHNGIIVNVDELWATNPDLKREYAIDTEIIPTLIRRELKSTDNLVQACSNAFKNLEGTYSVAIMFQDLDQFVLATNNGSLFYISDEASFIIFASEAHFLKKLLLQKWFSVYGDHLKIKQIASRTGLVIHLSELAIHSFNLERDDIVIPVSKTERYKLNKSILDNQMNRREVVIDPAAFIDRSKEGHLFRLLEFNIDSISNLKRCSKCLLPETFPFIEYDSFNVCNYCTNYKKKNQPKPISELVELAERFKSIGGSPDCIVPFSGGRDSTYALHLVKKELGLNPIAFTYDWGMVTDLARRNAARVCGKLGVENIIVAADIHLKRENIRKNVSAWLKNPHLGMVPLFMAGDKYFFHFSNKVLQQTGLKLSIWGSNPLENTDFKSGFTGIEPSFNKKRIDEINLLNKVKLVTFFGKQFLSNTAYINTSLIDTLGSFKSRYVSERFGYVQLFDYIEWDEKKIESLILNEYNWEKSIDTNSTWRIGDGTAAFYNYIYYTVAGFSEFDTFRSNQIREGQISREEGLELVNNENIPRYENLRWYLSIIGLDFESTIRRINAIPKFYSL